MEIGIKHPEDKVGVFLELYVKKDVDGTHYAYHSEKAKDKDGVDKEISHRVEENIELEGDEGYRKDEIEYR